MPIRTLTRALNKLSQQFQFNCHRIAFEIKETGLESLIALEYFYCIKVRIEQKECLYCLQIAYKNDVLPRRLYLDSYSIS